MWANPWDTRGHLAYRWHLPLCNLLGPLVGKVLNPVVGLSMDTMEVKVEKLLVGHLVEGLGKVEQDSVCLSSFIKLHHQVVYGQD